MLQRFISSTMQFPALREFVGTGRPVWGTCAGLIFLANKAVGMWATAIGLIFLSLESIDESYLQAKNSEVRSLLED